ncbi:MAG: D-alanine--D-alanine ligase family protein [Ornithinimicrobium sp.]|uniref:D-alanine--D-alanine ligase family protein n=1 Tax=Ornithinimicrobium sp. TaxID=1977084 RepID=UPI0026DF294F|nr:D-alanine--D-alanine ligase family protein [Ornithinimicrobium sp.]MDO5740323.1 D-alanine--D-alanine ligase family protein [Ornithinimicrobium sp.]
MITQPASTLTADVPGDGAAHSRIRVALVFGGVSEEHAISCATAASVLRAIDRGRYDVIPIGITRQGRWVLVEDDPEALDIRGGVLPEVPDTGARVVVPLGGVDQDLRVLDDHGAVTDLGEVDVVFPLLHGPFGEDGTIQGFLELADIRYVGCGVLASAAMMDKHVMKVIFAAASLPVGPYTVITDLDWRRDRAACLEAATSLQFPVFVKPARAGSSVGVYKVDRRQDLEIAIEKARGHDPKVLVEQGIVGREVECGVLQGRGSAPPRVSECGEIAVVGDKHEFYDFEAKYLDESSVQIQVPAQISAAVREEMRRIAATAFEAAGCEGLARVDCFVTDGGVVILNEINTMPGFTPFSMYPQAWAASGLSYPALIDELLALALARPLGLR